jgi:hypothetical protein
VIEIFKRWLLLPDVTPLYAMLGTIAANLLPGDPVWLGLIAPASSAKTELLNSTSLPPYVAQLATLTPAGLLSGTPKKQRAKDASGGVLRQIDKFGILCLKDFGSVLSMRPDAKAEDLDRRESNATNYCSEPPLGVTIAFSGHNGTPFPLGCESGAGAVTSARTIPPEGQNPS